jgi:Ca2+-binding RTX toxin-like protein
VLNEFIYTPGKIQQSTINVAGELKKSVNLTPFNLDPMGRDGGIQDPLFRPQYADDIIYGGWAMTSCTAGPETTPSPVLRLCRNILPMAILFNPGNILGYGEAKVWGDPAKAGEFAWYDEYDPLEKIEGSCSTLMHGRTFAAGSTKNTDGNDAIFGDLGNDWIVGGTGRDHLYGGWGRRPAERRRRP